MGLDGVVDVDLGDFFGFSLVLRVVFIYCKISLVGNVLYHTNTTVS